MYAQAHTIRKCGDRSCVGTAKGCLDFLANTGHIRTCDVSPRRVFLPCSAVMKVCACVRVLVISNGCQNRELERFYDDG